ncbi:MAG: uroporphyrinogen-III C-methyltransferase [Candidatus Omnitrophica bacterium]|nr:uroporphyrinogen-III C-methyltransferase [Candidatus Omnitrophota bacterium]
MERTFKTETRSARTGKVYLVGAGPGDPGLITRRGLEILRQADVVIHDYLVDKRILAEAREGAEVICCDQLGKKRYSDGFAEAVDRINRLMVQKTKEGKRVVRLKNGDPAVFSRLSQELEALSENGLAFEVVPGITAGSAAAAAAGIPLTVRRFGSSVVFVTGHEDPEKGKSALDWEKIASGGTIVLYMAVENIAGISAGLAKAGKPIKTPVLYVSGVGDANQKIVRGDLGNITAKAKKEGLSPPAVFIIGKAAKRTKIKVVARLTGRCCRQTLSLFTGLSPERFFLENSYFHLPLIKIEPLEDYREFDCHLQRIKEFDWLVFSSRFGVEFFFKRLTEIGYDARKLEPLKIAAIGNSTRKQLLNLGIRADLVPENESSEGLLKEFKKINLKNKRIFLPRSDLSDKGLAQGLEKMGARVVSSVAYRNVIPEDLPEINWKRFDEVLFTSPSTVRNFKKRYGRVPKHVRVESIGKVTAKEVKRCQIKD